MLRRILETVRAGCRSPGTLLYPERRLYRGTEMSTAGSRDRLDTGDSVEVFFLLRDFTHFDKSGNAIIVDVSGKPVTARSATAEGVICVSPEIMAAIAKGSAAKGDVLGAARIAGIMAVKKTADLIPLCHPLPVNKCAVDFTLDKAGGRVYVRCTAHAEAKTGVEMEALTGASVALLTIYDMCKGLHKGMVIESVRLLEKRGGKSGDYDAVAAAAVPSDAPIVAVCGGRGAGKTTLLAGVIPRLRHSGLRIAVIEQGGHDFVPGGPGADSFRLREAGAYGIAVRSRNRYMLTVEGQCPEIEELTGHFRDADLIFMEGGEHTDYPKIEILRRGISGASLCDPGGLLALCSDMDIVLPGVSTFPVDGYDGIAGVLLDYLRKEGDHA